MANPTTNYGFVLPTATDLVTDLPADFDVALQGVDTRLKALQPGTTLGDLAYSSATANTNTRLAIGSSNQVLGIVSGVPAWIDPNPGDITGVTAGTGISGGGTSGDVTITNSMATAMTTKGDLVPATGSGTFSRLAVGTNGQYLQADSTASTGLKWATVSNSPSYVGCSVSNTVDQSINNATETTITFDTEQWDTNSIHSTATNTGRFTVPSGYAGKWRLGGAILGGTSGTQWEFYIYVNGAYFISGIPQFTLYQQSRGDMMSACNFELNLAVGDYIEIKANQTSGGAANVRGQYSRVFFSYIGA